MVLRPFHVDRAAIMRYSEPEKTPALGTDIIAFYNCIEDRKVIDSTAENPGLSDTAE